MRTSPQADIFSESPASDTNTAVDYPLRLAGQLREHLRALRKRSGLTQAQLGQRLGLGQVRIAEIEANPGLVSVEQLVRILSALGATLVLRDSAAGAEAAPEPARKGPSQAPSKASGVRRRGPAKAPSPRGKPARAEPTPDPARDVATTARTAKHGKGSW